MARIIYSAGALHDLERIIEFLLESSPHTVEQAVAHVTEAVRILANHPRIGRRARGALRELVIGHGATGYVALYRFDAKLGLVRILRLRHQREAGYQD